MSSITVRNVPDEVHRALRVRAARHGRSTEAEIRVQPVEHFRMDRIGGLQALLIIRIPALRRGAETYNVPNQPQSRSRSADDGLAVG